MTTKTYILSKSFGSHALYPATLEQAMELFHNNEKYYVYKKLHEIADYFANRNESTTMYANPKTMIRAIADVLTLDIGTQSVDLKFIVHGRAEDRNNDTRPETLVTQEWKTETALWIIPHVFQRHAHMSNYQELINYLIQSENKHPEDELSFLNAFKTRVIGDKKMIWCYEEELDDGHRLNAIKNNNWNEKSTELGKIRTIVEFVNKYSHRDEHYDLIESE